MRGLLIFLFVPFALLAQSFQGGLRGSVMDGQGGAVAIAKVTLVDQATNVSRATISNPTGEFVFNAVNPATYSVLVESPGFKKLERGGVVVNTQEFVTLDLKLELGQVTETVNVTEETPLIETSNASTGQVIDNQKLIDLPNLGRNPFMMAKLSQNVVLGGNPKFNRMQDQSGSSQISIAGGPVRGNNYLLDGISITDSTNRAVIIPSIESVMEVKIQANTYDAEVGRTGGGTFNTYLRTGTNRLNGSLFGYLRETEWLANNFFANRSGTPRIEQPFRNYGGSLGGPVRLPKLYDGRNRTFFWIAGEAYRQTEAASTILSVPTAQERLGDFSQSRNRSGAVQTIYDPLSTRADGTRDPFPGNVVPANRINPIGLALASYYPLPNRAAFYGGLNFDATASQYNRADQTTWKLEHSLASWWRVSLSYLHYGSREPANNWFGNIASPGQSILYRKVDATQVNTTLTPTATTVVTARYGFNRFPNLSTPYSAGFDLTRLGFSPALISQLPVQAFPGITTNDVTSFGGGGVSQNVFHSKSFSISAAKYMGKHSVKSGFDFRTLHHDGLPTVTPGSYSFNNTFTNVNPTSATADSGSSIASMLLGYPSGGSVTTSSPLNNFVHYYGFFVHDDFRFSSKLTLNLGLRYEYETGIRDANNAFIVGFDTQAQNPIGRNISGLSTPGVIRYAGVGGNGTTSGNPNRNKLSPRIGVAYALNSKTTFRGGYGIFWAPVPFSLFSPIGYSQTTSYVASFNNNFTPANSLSNPFPSGVQRPFGNSLGELTGIGQSVSVYDQDARSTMVQQYSFDVQREVPAGIVTAFGYGGSKTSHLVQGTADININQLDPRHLSLGSALNQSVPNPFYNNGGQFNLANQTTTRAQLLLPFPQYTAVYLLNSDRNRALYHSVYMKAQKRFSAGLTLLSTYTWSQNKDASNAGAGNVFSSQSSGAQNSYDVASEYSLATIHSPHRWSSAVTYEFPMGRGRRYLQNSRWLDLAIGGWSINTVSTFQTGFPLAVNQNNTNSIIGASNQRPNATGVSPVTSGSLTDRLNGYLDRAAFSAAPQFTFGNLSRTIGLRGPGQANWDISLFKTFTLTEAVRAQFRAEALNAFNTPQFYGPSTNINSSTFGSITSQANFPRLIQLGVRLAF